jgi:hypothetical protein
MQTTVVEVGVVARTQDLAAQTEEQGNGEKRGRESSSASMGRGAMHVYPFVRDQNLDLVMSR